MAHPLDFDAATLVNSQLVVTGSMSTPGTVRLTPRRYRTQPQWTEIDVMFEPDEQSVDSAVELGFRVDLNVDGLAGSEGFCVVGATDRRFVPSFLASRQPDAGTETATSSAVLVTTILRIVPDDLDAIVAVLAQHPLAIGGPDGWQAAWCAVDRERGEVLVHSRWIDEISYRRADVSNAFHQSDGALAPHLVDDSDVLVADVLSIRE